MTEVPQLSSKDPASGRTYLRGVVTLALFSMPPIATICEELKSALDRYVGFIPASELRWESIGASSEEWKPFNESSIQRCKNQLKAAAASKRSLTSFELAGGHVGGDAPDYRFFVIGEPVETEFPAQRTLLQLTFPMSCLDVAEIEGLVSFARAIAATVPHVYGYLSPSLQWAEIGQSHAILESRAIVARYPGIEVQMNETGRTWLGTRTRGARWITFLGAELSATLGSVVAIIRNSPAGVVAEALGTGTLVRAGLTPELGDRSKQHRTPLLNAVAKLLEPITAFEEVVLLGSLAKWDKDYLRKWERRFLDQG